MIRLTKLKASMMIMIIVTKIFKSVDRLFLS